MFNFDRPLMRNIDDLQREMERYLHHMGQKKPHTVVFTQRTWQPAVDIYETPTEVVALVELAGVPEESIDLVVERDTLTLRGERKDLAQQTERRFSCIEIPFGPFQRTMQLPAAVNPNGASATYRAGFLTVVIPKLGAAPPRRLTVREQ